MLSTNAGPNWIRRRAKFFLFLLSTVGAVSRGTATIELVSSIESRRYVPALRDHAGRRRFAQAPRCLWLLLIRCWTQATLAPMSGSMSARFWIGSMSTCRIRQIASPKAGPFSGSNRVPRRVSRRSGSWSTCYVSTGVTSKCINVDTWRPFIIRISSRSPHPFKGRRQNNSPVTPPAGLAVFETWDSAANLEISA